MAGDLRQHFEGFVGPDREKSGATLKSLEAIHEALKLELPFKAYWGSEPGSRLKQLPMLRPGVGRVAKLRALRPPLGLQRGALFSGQRLDKAGCVRCGF